MFLLFGIQNLALVQRFTTGSLIGKYFPWVWSKNNESFYFPLSAASCNCVISFRWRAKSSSGLRSLLVEICLRHDVGYRRIYCWRKHIILLICFLKNVMIREDGLEAVRKPEIRVGTQESWVSSLKREVTHHWRKKNQWTSVSSIFTPYRYSW